VTISSMFNKSYKVAASAEPSAGDSGRLQGRRRSFVCPAVTEILCSAMSRGVVARAGTGGSPNDPRRSKRRAKTSKEKRRKMVSEDSSSPIRADGASRRRPPKKNKPVHARDESASTGTATATWEKKPALVFHDLYFGGDNQVSDALRAGLSEHCATGLRFVDRKQLVDTDAKLDQNRLQFSRKSPISRLFTPAELARALELEGLMVTAFDRRGETYTMKCRFFPAKSYCRIMGTDWRDFLNHHHLGIGKEGTLTRRVVVEVWAFRSHALPRCNDRKNEEFEPGDPHGALGLVVLHREEAAVEAPVVPAPPDEETEMEAAVAVAPESLLEHATAVVQEKEAAPAEPVVQAQQEDAPAVVAQVDEEGHAQEDAQNGGAEAHPASFGSSVMLPMAATVLSLLSRSNRIRTTCKQDDGKDDVGRTGSVA
jgi:hypothetical protein